ncbi:hypothetical protein [Deinococcus kurensis]|uniref:hypothetical protein n=1 Tax=Deinococcus kurensis TaxID=2662757 RepID=UPI0012D2BAC5|nr:hypothetical protein [Deinococcus kurensis]
MTKFDASIPLDLGLERRQWFYPLAFREGTLATARDMNLMQDRFGAGLDTFGSELDILIQQLVQAIADQIVGFRQMIEAFQGEVRERLDALLVEVRALLKTYQDELTGRFDLLKADVYAKLTELETKLKALIDVRVAEAVALAKADTDARFDRLLRLIKATLQRDIYHEHKGKDTVGINANIEKDVSTLIRVPTGFTFYVHKTSWGFYLDETDSRGWGVKITAPHDLMFYEESRGAFHGTRNGLFTSGGLTWREDSYVALRAGEQVDITSYTDGCYHTTRFTLTGYMVPDLMKPYWVDGALDKDGTQTPATGGTP